MLKFFYFTFFFLIMAAFAQKAPTSGTIPWEQDDIKPVAQIIRAKQAMALASQHSTALALIRFYQKKISIHSISRCPFKTSCSHFAAVAIKKSGFLMGTALFIDRYFYRENMSVYLNYPLFENRKGILKLNDDFYLTGIKKNQ